MRLNPLSELLQRKGQSGARIFDLTESNPTRAGIVYPAIALDDPRMMVYDPAPLGLLSARARIAEEYGVSADRVILTASTSEAYSWLFKLLCDPGDEILAPRPSYPLFDFLAALESVAVRTYPLRYHEGWFIDLEAIQITERTRAIVVVNPNNPTGSYVKPAELDHLIALCKSNGIALISDEVFSDYALVESPLRSLIHVEGVMTFCLNGLSKLVGMPQMKLGWIIANDANARERLELIADTYLSVGTPVQYALPKLLAIKPEIQRQIGARLRENLALAQSARARQVEGGWSVILQVPRTRSEEQWTLDLLEHCDVLVQPGYFYDFDSEAFLVLSLLTRPETFREALSRTNRLIHG